MPVISPSAALLALLSVNAASAAAAAPQQPTSSWVVDFDDAQCVALRDYGTDKDPLKLAVKAPPLGDVLQLAVIRPGGGGGRFAEHVDVRIRIDGRDDIETSMVTFSAPGTEEQVFRMNLSPEQFAALKDARTLGLQGRSLNERFELTMMEPLLKVLADCTEDLRRVWNVSEDEEDPNPRLNESATGDLLSLFRGEDYPEVALREGASGAVGMALLIDEQGRVADCTVIETSGFAALDAQSCGVAMQRARFEPAVGLDGKPAKDGLVQRVRWMMSEDSDRNHADRQPLPSRDQVQPDNGR